MAYWAMRELVRLVYENVINEVWLIFPNRDINIWKYGTPVLACRYVENNEDLVSDYIDQIEMKNVYLQPLLTIINDIENDRYKLTVNERKLIPKNKNKNILSEIRYNPVKSYFYHNSTFRRHMWRW